MVRHGKQSKSNFYDLEHLVFTTKEAERYKSRENNYKKLLDELRIENLSLSKKVDAMVTCPVCQEKFKSRMVYHYITF